MSVSLEELDRSLVQTKNCVVSFHRGVRFVRKKLKILNMYAQTILLLTCGFRHCLWK